MTTPDPGQPITLEPGPQRWRARYANRVIADTDNALILRERDLAPVVYFPREDVAMEYMGRSDHTTHCPLKGEAAYYTLRFAGEIEENIAWSYEAPLGAVERIARRIAFDPARIEVYEIDDARVNPNHRDPEVREIDEMMARDEVDEIVRHTDAGDGTSQGEHWRPNVEGPQGGDGGLR